MDIAEEKSQVASFVAFFGQMFGDLLGVSLLIFEDYVDDAGARLEGRVSNAAELFQALQIENAFVDHLMAVFFTV